jgi:hypothetical protein
LRVRYADDVKPGADWRKVAFIHLGSAAEQRTAAQPLPQVMRYRFEETSENSFIARGVDAGDYLLSVRVQQPPSPDHLAKTVAPVLMTFTVPANSDVVDLGEILLKPAP